MSLSDLFAGSGTVLPQIALLMFVGIFAAVVVRTVRRPRSEVRRHAHLPLHDGAEVSETEVGR